MKNSTMSIVTGATWLTILGVSSLYQRTSNYHFQWYWWLIGIILLIGGVFMKYSERGEL